MNNAVNRVLLNGELNENICTWNSWFVSRMALLVLDNLTYSVI